MRNLDGIINKFGMLDGVYAAVGAVQKTVSNRTSELRKITVDVSQLRERLDKLESAPAGEPVSTRWIKPPEGTTERPPDADGLGDGLERSKGSEKTDA